MEVVISILIVAILGAVAAPRFLSSLSYHRVESAARRIQIDCEWARLRAKTQSSDQQIVFEPAESRYRLPSIKDLHRPHNDYVIELDEYPYGTSIVSADFGGQSELVFNGFGLPKQTGTVIVRAGNFQRVISIDPTTGKANVSAL